MADDELVKKGFNHGYSIQKKSPDLAIKIANGFKNGQHPYAVGFLSGSIECIKELKQDVRPFLKLIQKQKNKNRTQENELEP